MAWTDSGRSLFIVVTDDAPSGDGLGSDAVLRYDTATDMLSLFARANIDEATSPSPAIMHFRGRLWVSTADGPVRVYDAQRNTTSGSLLSTWSLPGNVPVRSMAISRSLGMAFVASETQLYRIDLNQPTVTPVLIGTIAGIRSLAYSDHFGALFQEGAYVLTATGITHVPRFQANGLLPFAPIPYTGLGTSYNDIVSTPCGRLLLGGDAGAAMMRDDQDTRLGFEPWAMDEFNQVVMFAEGLVAPAGIPAGWVIDADATSGGTRVHPPSPDGAAWVVMLEIAKDHINGDQGSMPRVRDILRRYAGLMPDGIAPEVSADGIMHHWYNPFTGGVAPGWSDEYATLSTMLLVMSADRARRFYQGDPQIVEAADVIIGRVQNWDSYIQNGTNGLYLRAIGAGGPDFGTASSPFNEGVIFVEQAAAYGDADVSFSAWLNRSSLPSAEFVSGLPVSTDNPGGHLAAFVSLYPFIAQNTFREHPMWNQHIDNLLASNGAWVDDAWPKYMTVFSAGTTSAAWGGYHADSLSDHPGDVSTFPSLMGFSAMGQTAPSVGAYHAYRNGARQSFATGASLLFRRSEVDPGFTPTDAGLPDVVIGALGLAELIEPGTSDAVLAIPYRPACPADLAPPQGELNFFDISIFLSAYNAQNPAADLARPFGQFNFFDVSAYLSQFSAGCP